MSDSRGRRSPYEQGELKPSPQRHIKKKKSSKKSKKSRQLPPEAKLHVNKGEEDDDVQIIEAVGHGEEEGDTLTIKPPQTQASKSDKSHKHKKDKHRARAYPSSGRDHPFPAAPKRDVRDAREIVRERKKEREMKEKEVAKEISKREARKREESSKERERLERVELERRRERQVREEHEKEKMVRQQKRRDDRRQLLDTRREKVRGEGRQQMDQHRSRSRDGEKARDDFQYSPPSKVYEGLSKKDSMKGAMPLGGRSASKDVMDKAVADSDQDTRRVVVDSGSSQPSKKKERRKDYRDQEIEVSSHSPLNPVKGKDDTKKQEAMDVEEVHEIESDAESDSDSDSSDSADSSSEEEEDSSEEEEEEDEVEEETETKESSQRSGRQEQEDRTDDGRGKLRSKFDDHSDVESPGHDSDVSNSDDNYIPDSPEMSDMEENSVESLPVYLPAIQGCRSVEEFNCLNRIEEGTYGVVYRALDKKTNEIVALKRLKMEKEKEGFPITSLREINTLLKAQHENIVTVREIVVGNNMDKIYIVMDFVEHDLKSLMENMKNPFLVGEVKTLLQQLLRAVRHLHDNWILHRDLKTSNLLLSHKGILKVGDFGLAREYGSPLRNYTPVVVTLWYRAPELLLGCKEYSTLVDMWSVGCIFAEFLLMKALWPGKSEIDQINKIFKDLGTPTEKIWTGVMELPGMKKVNFNENPYNVIRNRFGSQLTDAGFDLLNRFFAYDPKKRITADDALQNKYFNESPLPVDPSMFPTWPARSEQTKKSACSPKPPSGGKAYQKLMDEEENITAGGFHIPSAGKGVTAFSLKF